MSNSLDPDQDRHYVGPDLGQNCLHCSKRLSQDDKSRPSKERVHYYSWVKINKTFEHKIVNIFLPISFKICFGCSKEPSH